MNDSQTDTTYNEAREFLTKSNLPADEIRSNREMIKYTAIIHYANLVYPAFFDLTRSPKLSIQRVAGVVTFQDIRFQQLQQMKLSTSYTQRPSECIDGWRGEEDLTYVDECVPIFIIKLSSVGR